MKPYLVLLNKAIEASDRTLEEVANHLKFSDSSLSKRLDGSVAFTVDEFYALCTFIKVPAGQIIDAVEPGDMVVVATESTVVDEKETEEKPKEKGPLSSMISKQFK